MHTNPTHRHKYIWQQANVRLVPSAGLCVAGATISAMFGGVRAGSIDRRFIAFLGIVIFVVFATAFVLVLTKTLRQIMSAYPLSPGRTAAIQFVMRTVGYVAVFLITLNLLGIPVGNLLIGGAALGIILGVAAQQALANFFASIVLIISHPFSVGQHVTINSGALGGQYIGVIKDMGLTHTRLEDEAGDIVLLPNATLLSGATITSKN